MAKLSAKAVEKTVIKPKEYMLADGAGLHLRVRPSGAKSWIYLFRLPGSRQLHRITISSLEDMSLKEARAILPRLRKQVADGIDPRNARAAVKAENTQAITMQVLFDAWIEFIKLSNDITPLWAKRHEKRWNNHLKAVLGMLLVRDVGRFHLASALDAMTRKGIKEETRKALTTLNLMMDYALTRHFIDQNPARMLKPKDFSATANRPRVRVLSLFELRKLWLALDQALLIKDGVDSNVTMSFITAAAIQMLILTGARRSEIACMHYDELDLNSGIWLLPANRTKNRQEHTIYLSNLARNLLNTLRLLTGHSAFVFDTGRGTKQCHIQPDSITRALDRLRKNTANGLSDLKPFTIHDLRRTAATAWGEYLKTAPHVIERMLNHQPLNKLVATYQRAIYPEEQKAAWLAWGEMVEMEVASGDGNVMFIRRTVND